MMLHGYNAANYSQQLNASQRKKLTSLALNSITTAAFNKVQPAQSHYAVNVKIKNLNRV